MSFIYPSPGRRANNSHGRDPSRTSVIFECSFKNIFGCGQSPPADNHLHQPPASHSERLRSTWRARRSQATLSAKMSMSNIAQQQNGHAMAPSRSQSPLRNKASMARLLGIRRPSDESPQVSTASSWTVHQISPSEPSPAPSSSFFSHTSFPQSSTTSSSVSHPAIHPSAKNTTTTRRGRSAHTNRPVSRRSSSSSELWGSPVTEEAVAMGLVKAPDDYPSSEEQAFYSIDTDLSAPVTDATAGHHHPGAHDRRPAPSTSPTEAHSPVQLKSPTSKALKRILKSSIGLRNLMAEQQERENLRAHSPSSTRKSMDHLWDSFPVALPNTHHGSFGKRIDIKQRWSPPAVQTHKVTNDRSHQQYRGRAPLKVIGLGDEIAEREGREEAALIAEEAAKRAASSQTVTRPRLHAPLPLNTFKSDNDTSYHPFGSFETSSPATTPSEELPGWTGYAHYVQSSSDCEEVDQHRFDAMHVAFQDELSPLEPRDSLLFSALRPVEQRNRVAIKADNDAMRVAHDTSLSSDKATLSAQGEGGRSLPQQAPHSSDSSSVQDQTSPRGSRHRGHSSASSLSMSPPAPPPSTPLPPVPGSLVGVLGPRIRSTTLQSSSATATPLATPTPSLTPTSPSFPSTPSSPMTPARSRDVEHKSLARPGKVLEPVQWEVDSPLNAHKQQQKHRRGLKKAPSLGSLYLTAEWPTPPQRASSIVEHPWKHSGPGSDAIIVPPLRAAGMVGHTIAKKPVRALSTCEEDQTAEGGGEALTGMAQANEDSKQGQSQGSVAYDPDVSAQANGGHQERSQHAHRHHRPGCSHHRSSKSSLRSSSSQPRVAQVPQHNRCVSHTWDEETEKIVTNFLLLSSRKRSGSSLTPLCEE